MAKFQNRDEYEKWKDKRSHEFQEKEKTKKNLEQIYNEIKQSQDSSIIADQRDSQVVKSNNSLPKLINCRTCGNEISINASSCPKCGDPQKEIFSETEIIKRKGGAQGFIFGIPMAIICFVIGFLSITGGGLIIGAPLVITSFLIPVALAFSTLTFLSGACPYCRNKVLTQDKKFGVNCPTCKKRIVIKERKFIRVDP